MFSENIYNESLAQLAYIESVKETMAELFNHLTGMRQSGMLTAFSDYKLAVALICEAIDEMYYEQALSARNVKENYERDAWQHTICELLRPN